MCAATAHADLVSQWVPPGSDSLALIRGPVLTGRESVYTVSDTLEAGTDYLFSSDYSYLKLARAFTDTVYVEYQVLPGFDGTLRRFAPLNAAEITEHAAAPVAAAGPTNPSAQSIRVAGTKKLSFGVGENRSGLVEQSLWLSLSGRVGPDLDIEGTISDRSLPTESITRAPSEFDQISLKARAPGFRSEFGDTQVRQGEFNLFNLSRRLSGLSASGEKGSLRAGGLLGQKRGQFRTNRFYGLEGNQGPYSLATGNRVAVVPGSETVWQDDVFLERGVERDYTIDYPTGTITFTSRRPMVREARVTVDYEIASSEYQSFMLQAGSGVDRGKFYADWLVHREWDNPDRPTSYALSDLDRALLAGAGDSATLAVRSGVDSVGTGMGAYQRDDVDTFFVHVGPGLGEFNVVFTYVGPSGGAYRAKGDGSYFFVGEHLGDYSPVVALPLPAEARLLALRAGGLVGLHRLDLEWAGTSNDANRLSSFSDLDNQGLAWLGRYSFGEETAVGGSVSYRHRDEHFSTPGRDARVDHDIRWGDPLGSPSGRENELGASLRLGRSARRAGLFLESRSASRTDRAWRTGGDVNWSGAGLWRGRLEILRREHGAHLEFDRSELNWSRPRPHLPWSLQAKGERRVEGDGYRFLELGSSVGPSNFQLQTAWRRTDSLDGAWQKQSDLYRATGDWHTAGARVDGGLTLHYQRREFASFQSGSEDRVLAESRWLIRHRSWSVRVEHRLTRSQALSQSEEYVPVDEGRGEFREVNGQIISDPLGNLIRVVNPGAYGEVARQGEKRANLGYAPASSGVRAELDLITSETAAQADLPGWAWLLPWYIEDASPTQRRILRGELSGGQVAYRWNLRTSWEKRLSTYATRPERYERLWGDGTLLTRAGGRLRFEWRAGAGREREEVSYPYDLAFALGSVSPAWRFSANTEVVLPLFVERYWSFRGDPVADWLRASIRGTARLGEKSRLVVEPSVNQMTPYQSTVPLAVADGRPAGTTVEWRLDFSLDLSRVLLGRVNYRGRAQSRVESVHRLDVVMEASF